ncbi:glycosyltransferase [Thermodesulfobacteriota bacterium]
MTKTNISIIIRCFNEERHIRRLLEGVLSQSRKDYEIIVVDSGSTDRTLQIACEYPVKVLKIRPEEFSFGYAINYGCRRAVGEFIVLISAHCYPTNSSWLENLIKMFDDSRVGLVFGKQRGNEVTRYFEHRIFEKLFPDSSIPFKQDPFCNNANAAIRRSLWERCPYDEQLTGLEDLDCAKKIIFLGYGLAYSADAEVVHVHEETSTQRFNRYKREAVALKRILPDSNFNIFDLIWLYSSNCLMDLLVSAREGMLRQRASEILRCRWHQFSGTFSGYRLKGALAKQMKMQFFYPDSFRGTPNKRVNKKGERPNPGVSANSRDLRIVALVPMRADSKRVPNKNIRMFNGKPLYFHILNSLLSCPYIEEIYVNTNSQILMEELPKAFDRVRVIPRPEHLCPDTVPMNNILLYDVEYVEADWYVQTHSTNPLLRPQTITRAIETILNGPQHDALFSVTPMYTRLWDSQKHPINHKSDSLIRTQDLDPIYEENSNLYIFKKETLKRLNNRIGDQPLMFEIPREEAWDIDEELDFRIAEFLSSQRKDLEINHERKTSKRKFYRR